MGQHLKRTEDQGTRGPGDGPKPGTALSKVLGLSRLKIRIMHHQSLCSLGGCESPVQTRLIMAFLIGPLKATFFSKRRPFVTVRSTRMKRANSRVHPQSEP